MPLAGVSMREEDYGLEKRVEKWENTGGDIASRAVRIAPRALAGNTAISVCSA